MSNHICIHLYIYIHIHIQCVILYAHEYHFLKYIVSIKTVQRVFQTEPSLGTCAIEISKSSRRCEKKTWELRYLGFVDNSWRTWRWRLVLWTLEDSTPVVGIQLCSTDNSDPQQRSAHLHQAIHVFHAWCQKVEGIQWQGLLSNRPVVCFLQRCCFNSLLHVLYDLPRKKTSSSE